MDTEGMDMVEVGSVADVRHLAAHVADNTRGAVVTMETADMHTEHAEGCAVCTVNTIEKTMLMSALDHALRALVASDDPTEASKALAKGLLEVVGIYTDGASSYIEVDGDFVEVDGEE